METNHDLGFDRMALAKLYAADRTIKAIVHFAETRSRTRNGTVKSMRTELRKAINERMSVEELCEAIRRLESIGYASLKVMKERERSIIEWKRSLRDLVDDAKQSGSIRPEQLGDGTRNVVTIASDLRASVDISKPNGLIAHRFRVRPDCEAILHLPEDLSAREAERIGDFVRTVTYVD